MAADTVGVGARVGGSGLAGDGRAVKVPLEGGRRDGARRVAHRVGEVLAAGGTGTEHHGVVGGDAHNEGRARRLELQGVAVARSTVVSGVGTIIIMCARGQASHLLRILVFITYAVRIVAWGESGRCDGNSGHNGGKSEVCAHLKTLHGKTAPTIVQYIAVQGGCGSGDVVRTVSGSDRGVFQQLAVGGHTRPAHELAVLVHIRAVHLCRGLALVGDTVLILCEGCERGGAEETDEQRGDRYFDFIQCSHCRYAKSNKKI